MNDTNAVNAAIPREIKFTRNFIKSAAGSVLVEFGYTRVICAVTPVYTVPPFLDPAESGWLTAEYAMLPASTGTRKSRERNGADGRSVEIQRLVGRSLRAAIDLQAFSGLTLYVDCDVLEADGGTRTAAVTGGWVALVDALKWLHREERLFRWPLKRQIAAVSVGRVNGKPVVDLDYSADSKAQFDMNLVMNDIGEYIEIQGTAERGGLNEDGLHELLQLGRSAINRIFELQLNAFGVQELGQLEERFD